MLTCLALLTDPYYPKYLLISKLIPLQCLPTFKRAFGMVSPLDVLWIAVVGEEERKKMEEEEQREESGRLGRLPCSLWPVTASRLLSVHLCTPSWLPRLLFILSCTESVNSKQNKCDNEMKYYFRELDRHEWSTSSINQLVLYDLDRLVHEEYSLDMVANCKYKRMASWSYHTYGSDSTYKTLAIRPRTS